MVFFLDLLGGKAIRARWHEKVRDFTTKRDSDGKVIKDGWSLDTFDRRRKELTDVLGWVVGGGGQNVPYEFADTEVVRQVRARVRAKAAEYGVASPKGEQAQDAGCTEPQPNWPQPNQPHAGTLVVPAATAASSGGERIAANWPQAAIAASSNAGSNGPDPVVPETANDDLAKAAKAQLQLLKGSKSSAA